MIKRLPVIPEAFLFSAIVNRAYPFVFLILCVCFTACNKHKKKNTFARGVGGYYYRLIDFETKKHEQQQGNIARLNIEFATQNDSVFWDSFNNLRDQFFVKIDSAASGIISHHVSNCSVGDSVELLIKPTDFFKQQFQSAVPVFIGNDSIVKARFRLAEVLDASNIYLLSDDPAREKKQIDAYYGSVSLADEARDHKGFYWVGKKHAETEKIEIGKILKIRYRGSFLNGRSIDKGFQEMEVQAGIPDQVLPGLNYVIERLKMGENVKIILPSRLAFGDEGSSDGLVPAGTPLIYEVTLISK